MSHATEPNKKRFEYTKSVIGALYILSHFVEYHPMEMIK